MTMVNLLLEKFGNKPHVLLIDVASEYYGVSDPKRIRAMAKRKEFPYLAPFKARDSIDAPYLVSIENLAYALEQRQQDAKR